MKREYVVIGKVIADPMLSHHLVEHFEKFDADNDDDAERIVKEHCAHIKQPKIFVKIKR